MKKILVTGVNGFVGHHVSRQLHYAGHNVIGVGNQPNLLEDLDEFVDKYISCDLTNPSQVSSINLSEIDAIINLAGFAKVGESKGQQELYNKVNVSVHSVLYQECINQKVKPRIVAISTGAVYDPGQPMPLEEDSKLSDKYKSNEYIVSKQLTEEAVLKFNELGLHCIVARPFNHSGPGQLPGFLLPDLGTQIKDSVKNQSPLIVGNLKTKRDFTDVRDVARAYIELATCDEDNLKYPIYNICSGKSVSGKEILSYLLSAYEATELSTIVDQSKIRDNEIMDIYGSNLRIKEATGWQPTISVEKMVNDYVDWQKTV
jgi:GDP-4-dehydro-6-deoxy-D-mannose reductase